MKKHGILNSDISRVLTYMGHTDRICVGDCGLPVPEGPERIDLALRFGVPSFLEVLREVAGDMKIEKIILAEEIRTQNPEQLKAIEDFFAEPETGCMPEIEYVAHAQLKALTRDCKAVIRTGETTPYSNIILQSGCIF